MRNFALTFVALLATIGYSAHAAPGGPTCLAEICVESFPFESVKRAPTPTEKRDSELTNGERLARGLPLKRPANLGSISELSGGPYAPTRRQNAAKRTYNVPSGTPMLTKRGKIKVLKSNGAFMGYITASTMSNTYFTLNANIHNALIVNFKISSNAGSASTLRLTMENSDISNFPLLGLVQGRDNTNSNLQPGSFHYGYITGIATPGSSPNAVPATIANAYSSATGISRTAMSDVWSYDDSSKVIAPQWVNSDGSKPNTYILVQSNALYIGGDPSAFHAKYPAAISVVSFKFVPI